MATATLNDLPVELICLILQQVRSGKDLHAFLRASPKIYRAFSTSKDTIVWEVAKRSMVSEVLVDAITAVKLRNVECEPHKIGSQYKEISEQAREKLLVSDSKTFRSKDWITSADLSTLHQLQSAVDYFVDDFCSQSLSILFNHMSRPFRELSIIERSRLQRAFLRYDIYYTLITYPACFHGCVLNSLRDRAGRVWNNLTAWEADEILSIWQYMRKRLGDVFHCLGEEVLHSVVFKARQRKAGKGSLLANSTGIAGQAPIVSRFHEGQDDFVFSEAGKAFQSEQQTLLASRSLPFLHMLFESGTDIQRRLVLKNQTYLRNDRGRIILATCRIDYAFRWGQRGLLSGQPTKFEEDKLNDPNLAWHWSSALLNQGQNFSPEKSRLRACGYVFWDEDRLQGCGITRDALPGVNRYVFPRRTNRKRESSIEKRLRDMMLPAGWDLVLVGADQQEAGSGCN